MTVTLLIIIVTSIISYLALQNPEMLQKLKHFPYQEKRAREYYRMLSGGFVHGSLLHLIINMYILFMFGEQIEHYFDTLYGENIGRIVFVVMYLLNIIAASIPTYFKNRDNMQFASVGASGAVSGLLFIFIAIRPWYPLQFIFLPFIDIPAIVIGIGYLIYSSYASRQNRGRIDHMAHFYGAIFGVAFLWLTKPSMFSLFLDRLVNDFSKYYF